MRLAVSEYASYGWLNYSALRLPSSSPAFVLQVNPQLRRESSTKARRPRSLRCWYRSVAGRFGWRFRTRSAGARTTTRARCCPSKRARASTRSSSTRSRERRPLGAGSGRAIEHHAGLRLCLSGRIGGLPKPRLAAARSRGDRRGDRNAYRASAPAASATSPTPRTDTVTALARYRLPTRERVELVW